MKRAWSEYIIGLNIIISPFLGAVIGYFTNWLAIKMLFRPHVEKRFFGVRAPFTPGLIPKRRYTLAARTGRVVSEHLLTGDVMLKYFLSDSVCANVEGAITGFFERLKTNDRTVGSLLEGGADAAGIKEIVEGLGGSLFDGGGKIREALSGGAENASKLFDGISKSEFFAESVRPVIIGLIKQNVKGFAALFVDAEKVCDEFIERASGYLANPDNSEIIGEKLAELYDEAVRVIPSAQETLLAETSFLSVEIGVALSKIDEKTYDMLNKLVMSKYREFITKDFARAFAFFDVAEIIEEQINGFEMKEAEDIIISVVDRELKAITYLGGVLGFIIGLIPPILQAFGIY